MKPDYDGLRIDPCLPKELSDLTVTRKFRGSTYQIHIVNRAGDEKGAVSIVVDGAPLSGNVIAPDETPAVHAVEVAIG